ncbi:hypothetical protein BT69DRAFT_1296474 [Atractiella rhizophila]|nr:hypothetical protein BT69DRAFT_1296474 [Atractiella rhizophila]
MRERKDGGRLRKENHGNLLWRGWGDYTVMLAEQTAYTIMEQLLRNASKMTTTSSTNQSKIVLQCYPNAPPMAVQHLPNASTSLRQSSPDAPPMSAKLLFNTTKSLSQQHIFVA